MLLRFDSCQKINGLSVSGNNHKWESIQLMFLRSFITITGDIYERFIESGEFH